MTPPILALPTDRPRRPDQGSEPAILERGPAMVDRDVTLAAFVILLYRYTRQTSITVQTDADHVLVVDVADEPTFDTVVHRVAAGSSTPGHSPVGFRTPTMELALYPDRVRYDASLFDEATVARLVAHLDVLRRAGRQAPEKPITRLPLLTAAERHTMLERWNDTAADLPHGRCLHDHFRDRARETPDAVAVLADEPVTYRQVDQRSDSLARRLVDLGVRAESVVGVCLPRSADLLVAILAVLKAGGAYLPLDRSYPQARLRHMLRDAECHLCVCRDDTLPVGTRVSPDERGTAQLPDVDPDQLCYVIYTSGSTGAPKGITLRHRGVVNNLTDINTRFGVGPQDRVLALSSPSFDMSVYEFLGLTLAGGTVVVPREQHPAHWADLLICAGVTVWNSAPALLGLLLDHAETAEMTFPALRLAMCGGDWIPVTAPDRLRAAAPRLRFAALGGATESSIHSTCYEVTETDPDWTSIPYGTPMANQRVYILDPADEPCPVGVPGELHLAGIGLAKGYLGKPELTAEKFVSWHGDRLYRTGDLARFGPDGVMELLGRLDFQVKINGLRIELGEIEAVLRRLPHVDDAVVTAHQDRAGDRRLVAYVVGAGPETKDLHRALTDRLPAHLVPASFVILDRLPLSPNGKIDRRALPAPAQIPVAASQPPRDETERRIAHVWQQVLDVPDVGRDHNFLALGGDSFKALRAAQAIDPRLSPLALLRHPTVAQLAEHLRTT